MNSEFIDSHCGNGNTASMTTESTTIDNKGIVAQAFAGLVETGDVAAVERVLSDGFVHHRPDSTSSTKHEWLASVRASLERIAGMRVEVLHVLADGEHVVMHSRRRLPSGPEIAVIDIMRFEGGLIAEAWETIEPTAEAAGHLTWWDGAGPTR
ncbi:putative SnoaL-like aldol condensation-catalyzing enzyme [Promicromonospora umidemergens]|nr:putative SnoaL-like aldol condensation-catalyzing enzyme [Promicromonospora umidemergens]